MVFGKKILIKYISTVQPYDGPNPFYTMVKDDFDCLSRAEFNVNLFPNLKATCFTLEDAIHDKTVISVNLD